VNERIRELAEQVGFDFSRDWQVIGQSEFKTYTEMIVRECARVVSQKTGPKSALNVLEHFGVEE
jgi:hypothetical protein